MNPRLRPAYLSGALSRPNQHRPGFFLCRLPERHFTYRQCSSKHLLFSGIPKAARIHSLPGTTTSAPVAKFTLHSEPIFRRRLTSSPTPIPEPQTVSLAYYLVIVPLCNTTDWISA